MDSARVTECSYHSTNVGYVGIECLVSLICEIMVEESAMELNFSMRNGVPKIGVDPGLKYCPWSTWALFDT